MKALIIMAILVIVLAVLSFILLKIIRNQSKNYKELKNKSEEQRKNILYLYEHATEIAEIQNNRHQTENEINEAKNDEEIYDIINAIISVNNNRVRNNKEN